MTENQARKIQLQTKIDLYQFSLSQTKITIHQIQFKQAIERLTAEMDKL